MEYGWTDFNGILRSRLYLKSVMDDQFIIVTRSVLVPGSLTINVIWKNSFAGFIKLQIRLLSIDKQNSYAIIAVKENDNKRE